MYSDKIMRSNNKNEIKCKQKYNENQKLKNETDTIMNILYVEEKIEKVLTTEANKIVRE